MLRTLSKYDIFRTFNEPDLWELGNEILVTRYQRMGVSGRDPHAHSYVTVI